jgi:glycosyltransferase involved in cell wall biosynthesis
MFLASNRFVPRKNLERLVEAYALYCEAVATERTALPDDPSDRDSAPPIARGPLPTALSSPSHRPWSLCLLGDGPLRARLIAQCHERGLNVVESAPWETREDSFPIGAAPGHPPTADRPPLSAIHSLTLVATPTADRPPLSAIHSLTLVATPTAHRPRGTVFFPGFREIGELPRFYAAASAFIHPALEEPWGLVINEAMASGLPVLSGNNVGAAEELVEPGRNGWTFDAWDASDIAAAMRRLSGLDEGGRREMGLASREILEAKAPTGAFGKGMLEILKL